MTINFIPHKKQYEAYQYLTDNTTTQVLYGGAAGGGKSYLGCAWLIILCLKHKGIRTMIGRSKLDTLKKTTLKTFYDVARDFNMVADKDYTFNGSSNTITFENGSEIILKDLFFYPADPEYDSLGSLEIAACFIDEIAQITDKARQVVLSRLGWKMKDGTEIKPKLYMSCNPNKGFAYHSFYLPSVNGTLPDDCKFIPALPKDNPHLSNGRMESLNNLTGQDRNKLLLGNWEYDSDPASLIDYDSILNLFNNRHVLVFDNNNKVIGTLRSDGSAYKHKCISVDVARLGKDKTVICVWIGLYLLELKMLAKHTTDEVANIIKQLQTLHNIPASNVIIDCDGVGGGVVDQLKGCVSFNNGGRPLNGDNYANLKSQCYFALSNSINSNEMYFPTNDATKQLIIQELEQVKRKDIDKDGKLAVIAKDQVKQVLGRSPDYTDAMMLRMYYVLKKGTGDFNTTYSFASF